MALNIARQPFIPALLTLAALTVAAMCRIDDAPTIAPELVSMLPATAIEYFQAAYPVWSHVIAGFIILLAGICLGRISTRYGLHASNSCLAIPFYGIVACCTLSSTDYLTAFTASLLLTFTMQNFCCACKNGYAFDAIFRASIYLGVIPFVYPPALPLLLLLPLAMLLFQRTLRELTVAAVGVALPTLVICYVAWGRGYDFAAPLAELWDHFITGTPLQFFTSTPLPALGVLGAVMLLTLISIFFFLSNAYTTGTKSRLILIYNISMLLLTAALLAAPSATPGVTPLLAVPVALFLPVTFVRIHHTIATPIYLALLAGTLFCIFLV